MPCPQRSLQQKSGDDQAAENPPAALAGKETTATPMVKKQFATFNRCSEDEQTRHYGRTRSKTRTMSGRDAGNATNKAAEDLTKASRQVPTLLATVEEPQNGPIG